MLAEEQKLRSLGWTEDCPNRYYANYSHPDKRVLLSFHWPSMSWMAHWNRRDVEYHWDKRTNFRTLVAHFKH